MALAQVTKFCPGCGITRPGGCYSIDRTRRDGLSNYCDLCNMERQKRTQKCTEWYRKPGNAERTKARHKAARLAGYKERPRPKGGFVHLNQDAEHTMCGRPAKGKTYTTQTVGERTGHLYDDNTCQRCRRAYEVLMRCTPLGAEQVIAIAHRGR